MRTTMVSIGRLDYPQERFRVVAIPNAQDNETIASLSSLTAEFPFLEVLEIPPRTDSSWFRAWNAWSSNSKAYWWHKGPRAGIRDLPPKKTRQLIYALYQVADGHKEEIDLLIKYIDADSAIPTNHFLSAVNGMRGFDVLQAPNLAGNLNASLAATWHAFDHMAWDGNKYAHLTANGRQPFWVLGKDLFFRAADLLELGGFHPWITIEDPEVGLRFRKNGKRLGVLSTSLIEEVPETFSEGIKQRKRWVCGFFQSLDQPLRELDYTFVERLRAWLIFLPCLSLWLNALGVPTGMWALVEWATGHHVVPTWTLWLAAFNLMAFSISLTLLYIKTWKRTSLVLESTAARIWYMVKINPILVMVWWVIWIIPLAIGFRMYLRDEGLIWQRTEKVDANHVLVLEN